jgi:hypothetical protein
VDSLLFPIIGALVLLAAAWALSAWFGKRASVGQGAVQRVLAANGAARCVAALGLLCALGDRGDQTAIAAAWERIEMPLLQALPDCPPDAKIELVAALDECAKACRDRELAKRLITMRNSLIA